MGKLDGGRSRGSCAIVHSLGRQWHLPNCLAKRLLYNGLFILDWLVVVTGAIAVCEESDGRTKNAPNEQNIYGYTGEP